MENEQVVKYEREGQDLLQQAQALKIIDQDSREGASQFLIGIVRAIKTIDNFFEGSPENPGPQKLAHRTWQKICDQHAVLVEKYKTAKVIVDQEIGRDSMEQKRIQADAEARARAEAQEAERKERERLERLATKQMDRGAFDKAENTLDRAEAVFVPPNVIPMNVQKTVRTNGGAVTMREDIEIQVVDPMAAIRAIAEGKLPPHLVKFELNEIKKFAKAMKAKSLPGISIRMVVGTSTRTR